MSGREMTDSGVMQRHGGDLYGHPGLLDFSANINPLGMPESVREAAVQGVMQAEHYPDAQMRALTEAYAAYLGVPDYWILFGNGASELIRILPAAMRSYGSEEERLENVIVTPPFFQEYADAAEGAGCRLVKAPRWEVLGGAVPHARSLLFIGNPANPDGSRIRRETVLRLAAHCPALKICVDESFLPFCEDAQAGSVVPYLFDYPNLFVIRSFTKIFAMPGLRLGALLSASAGITQKARSMLQPWPVSLPAQMAGEAALAEKDFVRRTVQDVKEERAFLVRGLEAVPFVDKILPSPANFILFHVQEAAPHALYAQMIGKGILIRDCASFAAAAGSGETGWYRIAVRTHRENEQLLAAMV